MTFASLQESLLDFRGQLISDGQSDDLSCVARMGTGADATSAKEPHWKLSPVSLKYDAADVTDDDNFGMALETNCQGLLVLTHHTPETYVIYGIHLDKQHEAVDYVTLANRLQIPLYKAKNTVKQTMQRGMHTVLHSALLWCF
jgi:hypothetical protein